MFNGNEINHKHTPWHKYVMVKLSVQVFHPCGLVIHVLSYLERFVNHKTWFFERVKVFKSKDGDEYAQKQNKTKNILQYK